MRKIEIKIPNVVDWTECDMLVNCLGMDKAVIVFEREQNQIFKRYTFNGTLTFTDKEVNGLQVFSEVSALNLAIATERTWINVRVTLDDVVWIGYFSPRNCKWDYNRKTFSVTPKADDIYEPFLNNKYEKNLYSETSYIFAQKISVTGKITNFGKLYRNALGKVVLDNVWSQNFSIRNLVTSFFDDNTNPVTGEANIYKQMMLAQKTNVTKILEPDLEEATLQMFSFEYAMKLCRDIFNVWWDLEYIGLDGNGNPRYDFILEHKSYFETVGVTHNLKGVSGMASTDKFYYDEDNVPKRITIRADGEEGLNIQYLAGLTGDEKEISIKDLATIIYWNFLQPNYTTSNDGFFLHTYVDKEIDDPEWFDYEARSIQISDLMELFWRHGREYYYGRYNDSLNIKSESVIPSILQDVQIKKCQYFEQNDVCETELSDILGELATIRKIEYSVNGGTKLTLAYSKKAANLIYFTVFLRVSMSGVNVGSGIIGYSAMFYPGEGVAVDLGVNIKVYLKDLDTSAESDACIDTTWSSTDNGGRQSFSSLWSGKAITGFEVYLDVPVDWDLISNVPIQEAEVCS